MELIGKLFGLTAIIISAMIFLIVVALLARSGQLDEAASAIVQILLIPVKVVGVFVDIVSSLASGDLFSGASGT